MQRRGVSAADAAAAVGPPVRDKVLKRALAVDEFFRAMPPAFAAQHDTPAQSFSAFLASSALAQGGVRLPVHVVPVGVELVGEQGKRNAALLEMAMQALAAFVAPLVARQHNVRSMAAASVRRKRWIASQLLDALARATSGGGALATLGVTTLPLMSRDGRTVVATVSDVEGVRAAVVSLHGLQHSDRGDIAHARVLKTVLHYALRLLSLMPCPYFLCLMNASGFREHGDRLAHLDETPCHLCPVCFRKILAVCRTPDVGQRLRALRDLHLALTNRSEAAWCHERMEVVTQVFDTPMPDVAPRAAAVGGRKVPDTIPDTRASMPDQRPPAAATRRDAIPARQGNSTATARSKPRRLPTQRRTTTTAARRAPARQPRRGAATARQPMPRAPTMAHQSTGRTPTMAYQSTARTPTMAHQSTARAASGPDRSKLRLLKKKLRRRSAK